MIKGKTLAVCTIYLKTEFTEDIELLKKLQNEYEGDLRELK